MEHFDLISAPSKLEVDKFSKLDVRNLIDYSNHPAYCAYINSVTFRSRLLSIMRFIPSFLVIKLKRAISYEAIPLHTEICRICILV